MEVETDPKQDQYIVGLKLAERAARSLFASALLEGRSAGLGSSSSLCGRPNPDVAAAAAGTLSLNNCGFPPPRSQLSWPTLVREGAGRG